MESRLDLSSAVDPLRYLLVMMMADCLMAGPATRQDEPQILADVMSGMRQIVHAAKSGGITPEYALELGKRLFRQYDLEMQGLEG